MSSQARFAIASRITRLLALGALAASSALPAAQAQTAPTLLPYTLSVIAGGAATTPAAGATCPASGNKSTDAYGDGCLATEVVLGQPRFVATDKAGVVYFADTNNGLIRRIDPLTGIVTTVAGGASTSPATGSVCGTGTSTDAHGDGCPATQVKLGKPEGLAFSPAGDLYFADNSFDDVRKVNMTTGIITNIAGNITTYGYNVNNTSLTGPVIAATQSYTNFPYGIAFDAAGNLYIADEGNQALEVVNLGTTSVTIQGVVVPAGTIAKIAGYGSLAAKTAQSGDCPDFVSTSARGGCYFGSWTDGALATVSNLDNPYDLAVDAAGNVFFANYFNYNAGKITPANAISNYAGKQGTKGTAVTRGPAGSFGIGNTFNVALDTAGDLYVADGSNGIVWRVDANSQTMYAAAGGATAVCAGATDAVGDGCPATQAIFSKLSGTGASLIPGGAGGLGVDPFGNLYIADSTLSVIRLASTGTQFGAIGANQPTQTVQAHFAAADAPASNPFSITSGAANFTLGAFTCAAANSDGTIDCTVAVTATPTTLGAITGTLTVKTAKGATANFPLNATYISSRNTRTTLSAASSATTCTAGTAVGTNTPITLTATVVSTGAATGNITFLSNGNTIGTGAVSSKGVATLSYTFSTAGTYSVTAVYSGDANFNTSTSAVTTVTSAAPSFKLVASTSQPYCTGGSATATGCVIDAGQTAVFGFTLSEQVLTGSVSFACTGLPAYSSCTFSPPTVTNAGCSTDYTVTVGVATQQGGTFRQSSLALPGRGSWQVFTILPGVLLALFIGLRRRRTPVRFGRTWMALALLVAASGLVACGNASLAPATPSGTSTVTVTATGSQGTSLPVTFQLTVK